MTLKQLSAELVEMVNEIDNDERYHYPNATVVENAPLALVQLNLETRVAFAQEVLRRIGYEGPALEVKKGPRKAAAR